MAESMSIHDYLRTMENIPQYAPSPLLSQFWKLLDEECPVELESLDRAPYNEFQSVWAPIHHYGFSNKHFPLFYDEYCAEMAKQHATQGLSSLSLHEDSSSKAIHCAGNVSPKLDYMDREIAKQVLRKMASDPRVLEDAKKSTRIKNKTKKLNVPYYFGPVYYMLA